MQKIVTKDTVIEELFKLDDKNRKDIAPDVDLTTHDIYEMIIPYYDALNLLENNGDQKKEYKLEQADGEKQEKESVFINSLDNLSEDERQLIIILNKMSSESIIKCIQYSNKREQLLNPKMEDNKLILDSVLPSLDPQQIARQINDSLTNQQIVSPTSPISSKKNGGKESLDSSVDPDESIKAVRQPAAKNKIKPLTSNKGYRK
ncbi:MAG: hypothetical protein DGJ47_000641 [Rickettsiaceae bacterium]